MTNRLTISDDIQLFFRPEGNAWYSSRSGKLPEQIEQIVYEWQNDNSSHPHLTFLRSGSKPTKLQIGVRRNYCWNYLARMTRFSTM